MLASEVKQAQLNSSSDSVLIDDKPHDVARKARPFLAFEAALLESPPEGYSYACRTPPPGKRCCPAQAAERST